MVALENAVSFDGFFRIDLIAGVAGIADVDGDGAGVGAGTGFNGTEFDEICLIALTGFDGVDFGATNFSVVGFAAGTSTILSLVSDFFDQHEFTIAGDAGGTGFHFVAGTFTIVGLGVGASEENVPLSDTSNWAIGVAAFGEMVPFSRVAFRSLGRCRLTTGDFEPLFRF